MKLTENSEYGNISDEYPIQYKLKQMDSFSPVLFRFSVQEYIRVPK
jgi:hypothetical protein